MSERAARIVDTLVALDPLSDLPRTSWTSSTSWMSRTPGQTVPCYGTSMWSHEEAHPGEYLRVRFLEPLGLSAADLARGCRMPRSRVSDLLAGRRGISADTAMRLAAFFRMEPEVFMALQADWELHQAGHDEAIVPLDPPGFLLGPLGATRIPPRHRGRPPELRVPAGAAGEGTLEGAGPSQPRVEHEEVRYADGTRALVAKTA